MNRVLLDQGLSPLAAVLLQDTGWDAIHVCDAGLSAADDATILAYARAEKRTCITLDHDFHMHLALDRSDCPSVVFLRIEGLDAIRQAELIRRVWFRCEADIEAGVAISVDNRAIRVRRLPLR